MNPRTLTIRFPDYHPGPMVGDCLESTGGSIYLVLAVHRVKHRTPGPEQAYRLTTELCDDLPLDTIVHPFQWDERGRHQPR